eukprot:12329909-Heterocapsa_arctica.AAC.1
MSSRRSNLKPGITSSTRKYRSPCPTTRRNPLPDRGGLGTSHVRRTWRTSREPNMEEEITKAEDAGRK